MVLVKVHYPYRMLISSEYLMKPYLGLCFGVFDGKALVAVLLISTAAARHLSTWLCLNLYLPWERLILQAVRICLRVAGVEHSGQNRSSFSHCCRFLGEGRTSYVALSRKLIFLASIPHRSFLLIFLCLSLSAPHFIHCPCLAW